MLAKVLLGFLADFVFDCSARAGRAFRTEFDRYLGDRGFVSNPPSRRSTAH
jgi:hypothetical protein